MGELRRATVIADATASMNRLARVWKGGVIMKRLGRFVVCSTVLLGTAMALPGAASGQPVCEDLAGDRIVIGEMRYHTASGTDTCFANSYWDGGQELALPCGGQPGGLAGANSVTLEAYAYHMDNTGNDSSDVLFTMQVRKVTSCGGPLCTGTNPVAHCNPTLRIRSDDPPGPCVGNACQVRAGKNLACVATAGIYEARMIVASSPPECRTSDEGCFDIRGNSCASLQNFF
jgi:hypothetical protein